MYLFPAAYNIVSNLVFTFQVCVFTNTLLNRIQYNSENSTWCFHLGKQSNQKPLLHPSLKRATVAAVGWIWITGMLLAVKTEFKEALNAWCEFTAWILNLCWFCLLWCTATTFANSYSIISELTFSDLKMGRGEMAGVTGGSKKGD